MLLLDTYVFMAYYGLPFLCTDHCPALFYVSLTVDVSIQSNKITKLRFCYMY